MADLVSTVLARAAPVGHVVVGSAVTVGLVIVVLGGPSSARSLLVLGLLALIGAYVTLVHNLLIFRVLAFVIAGLPFVPAPGLAAPLVLVLGIGVWVALVVKRRPPPHVGWVEVLTVLTVIAAGISVLVTGTDSASIVEYGRWAIAFSLVIPLRMLAAADLAAFGRSFVGGAVFGSAVGLVLLLVDQGGTLLTRLSVLGYDATGGNARVVLGSEAAVVRLTGTYVDPNMGGVILTVALMLAVALLHGSKRILSASIIGLAILLTLSRASLATVLATFLILVLAGAVAGRTRGLVLSGLAVSVAIGLSIDGVRQRLLDSFGPNDTGTRARLDAISQYQDAVSGHWWFGLGWGLDEFRDATAAFLQNYVANAPLLTVYRAGLIVGVLFVTVLIAGCVRSVRLLRRGAFAQAVIGAGFIGMSLVALQLDVPVALLPPATMAFGTLLAFVSHDRWQAWSSDEHEVADG